MDVRRRNLNGSYKTSTGGSGSGGMDNYLTIEALEDGLTASLSINACEYCIDGNGVWNTLTAGTTTPSINQGQVVSFRGNLTPTSSDGIGTFTISKKCNLKGNCMSMLFGDDAINTVSISNKSYAFFHLFYKCHNIIEVSPNFLPALVLANHCYMSMFAHCSALINAPELPSTDLKAACYCAMFYGCTSLTTPPELPATTLISQCYSELFYGCTSIVTAPELPATTLIDRCYVYMFYGCSKLNYIKAMFTTKPSSTYTNYWVNGVSSTGTFIKNKDATWSMTGKSSIPSNWTVQTI